MDIYTDPRVHVSGAGSWLDTEASEDDRKERD